MNKSIAVLLGLTVVGVSQAAIIVLDELNEPVGGQTVQLSSPGAGVSAAYGLNVPGGTREISLFVTSVGAGGASANGTVLDKFQLSATPLTDTVATIAWSNLTGAGLNYDLINGDGAFVLVGAYATVQTTWSVTVSTWGATPGIPAGTSTYSMTTAPLFNGDMWFEYDDFIGTADLADIDSVMVTVDPVATAGGASATIEAFAVPEPNAALLVAGLCGLGVLVRRFKK